MSVRRVLVLLVAAAMMCTSVANADVPPDTLSVACGAAGQTQPPPCTSNWYTSPVSVVWTASSGLASLPTGCVPSVTAIYGTDQVTPLSCTVTWSDTHQTSTVGFILHLEVSAPAATATPDRPPDVNGWYNQPVTVNIAGSAFSGISSCTPAETYGGAPTTAGSLGGTCTDNAGKTASASFPFRYDATPPTLTVSSQPADGLAGLSWHASAAPAPLAWVRISRRPGVKKAASSVLYTGAETSYQGHNVRNGTVYAYTITAADQAGNVTQRTVRIKPGVRLLSPAPNAHLRHPPTLRWTEIPKASYYNVQLFQGSKILSAWPTHASLKLPERWSFGGKRHRLAPGRYHWYVWPGYGPQSANRYGKPVGNATFVIR